MPESHRLLRRHWALRSAAPMFWLSVLFLANTAISMIVWIDVPRVREAYHNSPAARRAQMDAALVVPESAVVDQQASRFRMVPLLIALLMWPLFIGDFLFYFLTATGPSRFTTSGLLSCFCPQLRFAAANPEMRGRIWLPKYGWTRPNSQVRRDLEKHFSMPMIIIALMILPILLIEFGLKEQLAERTWLRVTLHVSTGTIWFAFALEFIMMCSVSAKKFRYCKTHWLDLAIILLPLLSFLRSLRVLRATRLASLTKVQQLTRLGRVYRLRGLAIKAFRALAVFEVMNRLLRITPERQVELLTEQLAENEAEARYLRRRIASIQAQIAARDAEEQRAVDHGTDAIQAAGGANAANDIMSRGDDDKPTEIAKSHQ